MSSSTPLAQYAASLRSSGTGASLGLERTDQVLQVRYFDIFRSSKRVHVGQYTGCQKMQKMYGFRLFPGSSSFHAGV